MSVGPAWGNWVRNTRFTASAELRPLRAHPTATRESTFAPSYHFVTDMGSAEAWTNLPGGPSESRFSKYYKIDIQRWCDGEFKRLALDESISDEMDDDGVAGGEPDNGPE